MGKYGTFTSYKKLVALAVATAIALLDKFFYMQGSLEMYFIGLYRGYDQAIKTYVVDPLFRYRDVQAI